MATDASRASAELAPLVTVNGADVMTSRNAIAVTKSAEFDSLVSRWSEILDNPGENVSVLQQSTEKADFVGIMAAASNADRLANGRIAIAGYLAVRDNHMTKSEFGLKIGRSAGRVTQLTKFGEAVVRHGVSLDKAPSVLRAAGGPRSADLAKLLKAEPSAKVRQAIEKLGNVAVREEAAKRKVEASTAKSESAPRVSAPLDVPTSVKSILSALATLSGDNSLAVSDGDTEKITEAFNKFIGDRSHRANRDGVKSA